MACAPRQIQGVGDMLPSSACSQSVNALLNSIDQVRVQLCGIQEHDQAFYEELLASLPQFVACGPQSAGKSSVIRRISGISLPEASTLCTRIATVIQIRREMESSVQVSLIGPKGEKLLEEVFEDSAQVCECVSKAQEIARRSSEKKFVDDHTVIIRVCGPDRRNVTLVDLPGFHTADDEDSKTVNAMVQRYIQMPGTLALHVIKGDQDYGSLLGNDFMRQHSVSRVTVLTHCDNLKQIPADKERLSKTLDITSNNSSLTFAVDGSLQGPSLDQELVRLKLLPLMDSRIEIGAGALGDHLEERIQEHLRVQLPKAFAKLTDCLKRTAARLEEIRETSPADALLKMAQTILVNFQNGKRGLLNEVRPMLERMTAAIKNYRLVPLTSGIKPRLALRDEFDEPYEIGQKNYVRQGVTNTRTRNHTDTGEPFPVVVTQIEADGDDVILHFEAPNDPECRVKRPGEGCYTEQAWTGERCSPDCLMEDINQLATDRGIRNMLHIDRQPIIEVYAQRFAKYYTREIQSTKKEVCCHLGKFYDEVFSKGLAESVQNAGLRLRSRLAVEEAAAATMAESSISMMAQHNTDPSLIFTPNEHYLNDLVQRMVAADAQMGLNTNSLRPIMHNVRAFLKVQRKYISEMASKELLRTLVSGTQTALEHVLELKSTDYEKYVREPATFARERKVLEARKHVLEQAIATLQGHV